MEIENIAPVLRKDIITSSQRHIIAQLKYMANSICRDTISPEYINKSFNKFKRGFVYYDETGHTVGFCIWSLKKIESKIEKDRIVLFIHLLCGKKQSLSFGNRLFPDLELFCKDNAIDIIELEPANSSLQKYYESYGFQLTEIIHNRMTKRIDFTLHRNQKTRKRKHKIAFRNMLDI